MESRGIAGSAGMDESGACRTHALVEVSISLNMVF